MEPDARLERPEAGQAANIHTSLQPDAFFATSSPELPGEVHGGNFWREVQEASRRASCGKRPSDLPEVRMPRLQSHGVWSDVVVRHSGFIRCFLNRDEDQRFLDAFVRPWSKTLSDRCLQREKDIEVLMTSALGGATAAVGDAGGGGGGGGASVVAAALMDIEHCGGGEEESQHGS